jgi:hypothetical protein
MSEEQVNEIRETARELGLSQNDVIRQTVKLYLPQFRERMKPRDKRPRFLSAWDALHCGRGLELNIVPGMDKVSKVSL